MRRGVRLGVDVGKARVGLSASDADGILATPLAVVRRTDEPAALRQLKEIIAEYEPIEILAFTDEDGTAWSREDAASAWAEVQE